jgi:Fic family protein
MELNHLRRKELGGSTNPLIFFQLKQIFHIMESVGSARIEGNNTTISEYVENVLDEEKHDEHESIKEIQNMERALTYIEENIDDRPISRIFISEIHQILMEGLSPDHEGDYTPGVYRQVNVSIAKSEYTPPDFSLVAEQMEELLAFINQETGPQFDLLRVALAHHRFVWIHPFRNGNGRTVRMLTYAMLVKMGFRVNQGRLINPTAVFFANRDRYYENLSAADTLTEEGLLQWSEYLLEGLLDEINKVDHLADYEYLKNEILLPAIENAKERVAITENEYKVLKRAVSLQVIQAADVKEVTGITNAALATRLINKMKEAELLMPLENKSRKYVIRFNGKKLFRSIFRALSEKGFVNYEN